MEIIEPDTLADIVTLLSGPAELRRGFTQVLTPAQPAAGAAYSRKVAADYWERLIGVSFTLTTSAVVANRTVEVNLTDDQGRVLFAAQGSGTVVASSTLNARLETSNSGSSTAAAGSSYGHLFDQIAKPGWIYNIAVAGIDVADQLSALVLVTERYPSNWADGSVAADSERMLREIWQATVGVG